MPPRSCRNRCWGRATPLAEARSWIHPGAAGVEELPGLWLTRNSADITHGPGGPCASSAPRRVWSHSRGVNPPGEPVSDRRWELEEGIASAATSLAQVMAALASRRPHRLPGPGLSLGPDPPVGNGLREARPGVTPPTHGLLSDQHGPTAKCCSCWRLPDLRGPSTQRLGAGMAGACC